MINVPHQMSLNGQEYLLRIFRQSFFGLISEQSKSYVLCQYSNQSSPRRHTLAYQKYMHMCSAVVCEATEFRLSVSLITRSAVPY